MSRDPLNQANTGPELCGAEIYRDGKPTEQRCAKPAGHKSAHSPWWPVEQRPQTRQSKVQVRRIGGYDPKLGPKHPDNQDPTLPPAWPSVGDHVDYHSIIGGPVTQHDLVVRSGPQLMGRSWVVWLTGKAGCVAVEACSRVATQRQPTLDDGTDFWIWCLRQLTYVSEPDEARLRQLTDDQLRLIEELLHRQAVKHSSRGRV